MYRIISLLGLQLIFLFPIFGQEKNKEVEYLIQVLEEDTTYLLELDTVSSICERLEEASKHIGFTEGMFYADMVRAHLYKMDPEKSELYLSKMEQLSKTYKITDSLLVEYYLAKGFYNSLRGDLLRELSCYLAADSVAENIADPTKRLDVQLNVKMYLMHYYKSTKEYRKSIELGKELLKKLEQENRKSARDVMFNIGVLYSKINKYDSSNYYMNKSIQAGAIRYTDAYMEYLVLANNFAHQQNLDSAKYYITKYLKLSDSLFPNSVTSISAYLSAGSVYSSVKEFDSSYILVNKAIDRSKAIGYKKGLVRGYKILLKTELKSKEDTLAIEYFERYETVKDSLYDLKSRELEKDYEKKYELEKKKAEIKGLELKQSKELMYRWGLILTLIIALLFFLFVIARYNVYQRKLKQKMLEEQILKLKAERNLKIKEEELDRNKKNLRLSRTQVEQLKQQLLHLEDKNKAEEYLQNIVNKFNQNYISDREWSDIFIMFNNMYPDLQKELETKNIQLTVSEKKILILLKLDYSNGAMSEILKISLEGVKKSKQRLKKKVGTVYETIINNRSV